MCWASVLQCLCPTCVRHEHCTHFEVSVLHRQEKGSCKPPLKENNLAGVKNPILPHKTLDFDLEIKSLNLTAWKKCLIFSLERARDTKFKEQPEGS